MATQTELLEEILSTLKGWGTPNGVTGPRPRAAVKLYFTGEGRTQQSFKDECDINRIMAKHRKTGELTHLAKKEPTYGDFTQAVDYATALNSVMAAQDDFNALSARIRERMGNDPAQFLQFMADPDNLDEAIALGLSDAPDGYTPPDEDPIQPAQPPVEEPAPPS